MGSDASKTAFDELHDGAQRALDAAMRSLPKSVPAPRLAFVVDPLLRGGTLAQYMTFRASVASGASHLVPVKGMRFTKTSGIDARAAIAGGMFTGSVANKTGSLFERILHHAMAHFQEQPCDLLEATLLLIANEMHATTEQLGASCVHDRLAAYLPFRISSSRDYENLVRRQMYAQQDALKEQYDMHADRHEVFLETVSPEERERIEDEVDEKASSGEIQIRLESRDAKKTDKTNAVSTADSRVFNRQPPSKVRQIEIVDEMPWPLYECIRSWLVCRAFDRSALFRNMVHACRAAHNAHSILGNLLDVNSNTVYVGIWLQGDAQKYAIQRMRDQSTLSETQLSLLLDLRTHIYQSMPNAMEDDVGNYISLGFSKLPFEEDEDPEYDVSDMSAGTRPREPPGVRCDLMYTFVSYYVHRALAALLDRKRNPNTHMPVATSFDPQRPKYKHARSYEFPASAGGGMRVDHEGCTEDEYFARCANFQDDMDLYLRSHSVEPDCTVMRWILRENGTSIPGHEFYDGAQSRPVLDREGPVHAYMMTAVVTERQTTENVEEVVRADDQILRRKYLAVDIEFEDTAKKIVLGNANEQPRTYFADAARRTTPRTIFVPMPSQTSNVVGGGGSTPSSLLTMFSSQRLATPQQKFKPYHSPGASLLPSSVEPSTPPQPMFATDRMTTSTVLSTTTTTVTPITSELECVPLYNVSTESARRYVGDLFGNHDANDVFETQLDDIEDANSVQLRMRDDEERQHVQEIIRVGQERVAELKSIRLGQERAAEAMRQIQDDINRDLDGEPSDDDNDNDDGDSESSDEQCETVD